MGNVLPSLAPAKLPRPLESSEQSLRGKLARKTRAIRDLEARHERLVERHRQLVAERRELALQWDEVRKRRGA